MGRRIDLGGVTMEIVVDAAEVRRLLTGMIGRLAEPAPLWEQVAAIARARFRHNFEVGGEPPWRPLAPSTIAAKARAGLPALTKKGNVPRRLRQGGLFGPGNVLIATGAMRDAASVKGAKGAVMRVTKDGVFVGVSLVSKKGFPYPVVNQATRPFLTVLTPDIDAIEGRAVDYVEGQPPRG